MQGTKTYRVTTYVEASVARFVFGYGIVVSRLK